MLTNSVAITDKKPNKNQNAFITRFKQAWSIGPLRNGLIFFAILLLFAIIGPAIAPMDPKGISTDILFAPGQNGHLLGTDSYGRDVLSRLLHGTKTSLLIGFIAALISGVVGTALGAIAGYFGGKIDQAIVFLINVFYMIPTFFLILIIIALFGSSIINVMVVIGLTSWVNNAQMMRTQVVSLRDRNFVKGSQTIGEGRWRILLHHIIPNGIYPIIVNTTKNISSAILIEANLAFLGLGDPNIISWGQIISEGKGYLSSAWWITTFPGIATVFCVWTFFLIGDGLNRFLAPKLQQAQ